MTPRAESGGASTVLVTGASGFTGAALLDRLRSDGYNVLGLSRTGPDLRVDLCDAAAVRSAMASAAPDMVVHLGGLTFAAHPTPSDFYHANVAGAVNLLEALRAAPVQPRVVILASSATVYAPELSGVPITENHTLGPQNHYGMSKLAMEQAAALYASDLPLKIVRSFNYTGPGQASNFLVPKLVEHYASGANTIRLGNLDLDRDISSLDDTIEAYVRLLRKAEPGRPVNLCSGETVRLRALLNMLSAISGRELTIETDPALIRRNEPEVIVGSRAKLDSEIGAWPRQSLSTTLKAMYDAAAEKAQR